MPFRLGAKAEVQRSRCKVAVDADEGWRRWEDNMVEIRRSKRKENLLKKWREGMQQQQFVASLHSSALEKKSMGTMHLRCLYSFLIGSNNLLVL
ncbi:importin alpha isoform 1 [Perilla frutescens var. hirtella]|nr:importin alpha isoform 1 [Perilla frutescens var. hirtella]